MNVDGARVRVERWLNFAVLPSHSLAVCVCVCEWFNAPMNWRLWVHDNKSKWNFYLTNHKRLRFIGAEKYSRQTKRRTPFCAYFGVLSFFSLWFMRSNLILFSEFSSNSMCVCELCCQHRVELPSKSRSILWAFLSVCVGKRFHFVVGTDTQHSTQNIAKSTRQ